MKSAPIDFKYTTRAAKQYRDKLIAAALGEPYSEEDLSPEEGVLAIEPISPDDKDSDPSHARATLMTRDEEGPGGEGTEESKSIFSSVAGAIVSKYTSITDKANVMMTNLDEFGSTNPTIMNLERKTLDVMDGLSNGIRNGAYSAAVRGKGLLSTLASYTPLGCLTSPLEEEQQPEPVELQQLAPV
jgi:hypothetical protein